MNYYIKRRNIALAILFTIITFGIYGLYWIYKLTEETNIVTKKNDETSPALVLLFYIITCGIYGVYWAYKQGEKFRDYDHELGKTDSDNYPITFLALYIANYFVSFLSLIGMAIMQDKLNKINDANLMAQYSETSMNTSSEYEPSQNEYLTTESENVSEESENATAELSATEHEADSNSREF